MRAVSLSDKIVQAKIAKSFIPLKVVIPYRTKEFPLDWPAMKMWRDVHKRMGGDKCEGLTGCTAISPDLKVEYGNTGSAFVWEMFDSIAYDAEKFAAMLDRSLKRFESEQKILSDKTLTEKARARRLAQFYAQMRWEISREGRFHWFPPGFTIEGAKELFRLSGDLKDRK